MTIAVTPEQEALRDASRRWAERHCSSESVRALVEAERVDVHDLLRAAGEQGLLGIHVGEEYGGGGGSLVDLAVVLEEFGRALVPGQVVPTVLAALVLERNGGDAAAELLPALVAGEVAVGVGIGDGELRLVDADGGLRLAGTHGAVLAAEEADRLLLPADHDGTLRWVLVDRQDLDVKTPTPLDGTRRVATVTAGDEAVPLVLDGLAVGEVEDLTILVLSAEAAGVAGWCLDASVEYARVREQFGRPIGIFQAVKHRCADMLVAVEEARAAAWDAARAAEHQPDERHLAAVIAAATAPEAAARCAKDTIQLHGGIGFTWEHDAHLYLRRAIAVRQVLGRTGAWLHRLGALAVEGRSRSLTVDVGASDDLRGEIRGLAEQAAALEDADRRRFLADHGFLAPHWPAPWGRDADPQAQLVIAEEMKTAGVSIPSLIMGDWVLPTLIAHGTEEQKERFMLPTLYGEITWCQMFSEPGAGSDLAGLSTKAEKVDGGWRLTGQKVWTSIAQWSDWAICLARTNPDAPKHLGISYFLVDMKAEGIDIRPLRELTGHAMFNEVFLDQVFVPDDLVVGEVDAGWSYARTTLDSERVAIASGIAVGDNVRALIDLAAKEPGGPSAELLAEVGRHVARETSLAVLGARMTTRALAGLQSGPTASVRKLVSAHQKQDVAELGLELLGPVGATMDDAAAFWGYQFLLMRSFTIFGGTSEIQRNVIGERILGLPRDDAAEPAAAGR